MENELIRSAAKALGSKINCYNHWQGKELRKLELGLEIFLINVSKIIIIYSLAALLGSLWQTLLVHCAFAVVKRYSFGLHALNSTVCTVVSCLVFVFVPILLSGLGLSNVGVVIVFGVVIFTLYMYAPADTKARPLIGKKLRETLKRKAVICGVGLMVTALLIPDESVKLLLAVGAIFQIVMILPFAYKILKRSGKNYENYECA